MSNFSTVKLMGSIVPEKETSERNDLGMTGGSIFFFVVLEINQCSRWKEKVTVLWDVPSVR